MVEAGSTLSRHDLEAKIVKRCWEDDEFRKEFTADPAGSFVKYLEVPLASLPKIVIHEERAGSWHIVLPSRPLNSHELSEQDMERVAGAASVTDALKSLSRAVTLSALGAGISASGVATAAVSLKQDQGW
jgi:hypothetical protein